MSAAAVQGWADLARGARRAGDPVGSPSPGAALSTATSPPVPAGQDHGDPAAQPKAGRFPGQRDNVFCPDLICDITLAEADLCRRLAELEADVVRYGRSLLRLAAVPWRSTLPPPLAPLDSSSPRGPSPNPPFPPSHAADLPFALPLLADQHQPTFVRTTGHPPDEVQPFLYSRLQGVAQSPVRDVPTFDTRCMWGASETSSTPTAFPGAPPLPPNPTATATALRRSPGRSASCPAPLPGGDSGGPTRPLRPNPFLTATESLPLDVLHPLPDSGPPSSPSGGPPPPSESAAGPQTLAVPSKQGPHPSLLTEASSGAHFRPNQPRKLADQPGGLLTPRDSGGTGRSPTRQTDGAPGGLTTPEGTSASVSMDFSFYSEDAPRFWGAGRRVRSSVSPLDPLPWPWSSAPSEDGLDIVSKSRTWPPPSTGLLSELLSCTAVICTPELPSDPADSTSSWGRPSLRWPESLFSETEVPGRFSEVPQMLVTPSSPQATPARSRRCGSGFTFPSSGSAQSSIHSPGQPTPPDLPARQEQERPPGRNRGPNPVHRPVHVARKAWRVRRKKPTSRLRCGNAMSFSSGRQWGLRRHSAARAEPEVPGPGPDARAAAALAASEAPEVESAVLLLQRVARGHMSRRSALEARLHHLDAMAAACQHRLRRLEGLALQREEATARAQLWFLEEACWTTAQLMAPTRDPFTRWGPAEPGGWAASFGPAPAAGSPVFAARCQARAASPRSVNAGAVPAPPGGGRAAEVLEVGLADGKGPAVAPVSWREVHEDEFDA
eukprot:EG_transcript_2407